MAIAPAILCVLLVCVLVICVPLVDVSSLSGNDVFLFFTTIYFNVNMCSHSAINDLSLSSPSWPLQTPFKDGLFKNGFNASISNSTPTKRLAFLGSNFAQLMKE